MKPKEPPISKGDIVKVKIETVGAEGDGIAKIEDFVLFVDRPVEIGKTYRVLVRKVLASYAFSSKYFDKGGE